MERGFGYCGLACDYCSDNQDCVGCKQGGCIDQETCRCYQCCTTNNYQSCYKCPDFFCQDSILHKLRIRAFCQFIGLYGEEKLKQCLKYNTDHGIVYHYPNSHIGDYDQFECEDEIIEFIFNRIYLEDYHEVMLTPLVGNIEKDVCLLLDKNHKTHTKKHSLAVAKTAKQLARQFHLDEDIAYQSALLHDVGVIIKPENMLKTVEKRHQKIDEAERRYPFLLHQRISQMIARDYFKINNEIILNAIACHTTLKANPTPYDMLLFLADKISWDQDGIPPYLDIINKGLDMSLEKACYDYIEYLFKNNKLLYPHQNMLNARIYFIKTQE